MRVVFAVVVFPNTFLGVHNSQPGLPEAEALVGQGLSTPWFQVECLSAGAGSVWQRVEVVRRAEGFKDRLRKDPVPSVP